ncbi:hypothetical protein FVO58_24295 [Metabacillus halosaccharovorans]|nr:hypothetical protein [Metabacillus halosaccharovorans]
MPTKPMNNVHVMTTLFQDNPDATPLYIGSIRYLIYLSLYLILWANVYIFISLYKKQDFFSIIIILYSFHQITYYQMIPSN